MTTTGGDVTTEERALLLAISRAVVQLLGTAFGDRNVEMTALRLEIGYRAANLEQADAAP